MGPEEHQPDPEASDEQELPSSYCPVARLTACYSTPHPLGRITRMLTFAETDRAFVLHCRCAKTSRNRFLSTSSRGDFTPLSNQLISFPSGSSWTLTGALTVTVSRVAGPSAASFMKPHRRNSATASAAASNRDAAGTCPACMIPSPSVKDTRQVWVFGTTPA